MEPHGLVDDHFGVFQALDILQGERAVTADRIDLVEEAAIDLRVAIELLPDPGEGAGGGLMPADDHPEDFFQPLLLAHWVAALFISRGEENAQQFVLCFAIEAAGTIGIANQGIRA